MLKPAILYKDKILENYSNILYDVRYQWYFSGQGTSLPNIQDNTYNRHCFASVDKNNNVVGFVTYGINSSANSCNNFGIISFDKGNIQFIRDVKQALNDIFYKYNFNRIDFYCFADNPALRGYRNFIKKYGGREVGFLQQSNRLLDGKLHDFIIFEILKSDYKI